jgi:hypothetical protein
VSTASDSSVSAAAGTGSLHHVELWVPDLARARAQWGWLLGELGYEPFQDWRMAAAGAWAGPTLSSSGHPR